MIGFFLQSEYLKRYLPEYNKHKPKTYFTNFYHFYFLYCFFRTGDVSTRRLKLWELSFEELLNDPLGRETLQKFLDKEYSGENLRFWLEVQKLRKCSSKMVPVYVTEIYNEFIDSNATSPVNIDCKVMEITEDNLKMNPNRWTYDEAAVSLSVRNLSIGQNVTVEYDTVQCDTVQYDTVKYDTRQYRTVQFATVQYGTVQHDTIQYDTDQNCTI